MTPRSYEERVEYAVYRTPSTDRYYVRLSMHGAQHKHSADSLEHAREIRDALLLERDGYTPDRLPSTQPQEGESVATEAEPKPEIPEALRPAYDALIAQRDQMEDIAAPLRDEIAKLDQGLARVQSAIDALEGREPDASAELRQPGALAGRLPASVRNAFQAPPIGGTTARRPMITREQSDALRTAVLDALPIGEDHGIGRSELTPRIQRLEDSLSFRPNKGQVSSALANLRDNGLAARSEPDNPKDIVWWRPESD